MVAEPAEVLSDIGPYTSSLQICHSLFTHLLIETAYTLTVIPCVVNSVTFDTMLEGYEYDLGGNSITNTLP